MIKHILLIFALIATFTATAQKVPSRMEFAGLDLRLTKDAIKGIQANVDAMTRSPKYFHKSLEKVNMYMPIIERIFAEEGLPDDFKYLVIQESALVSDAVSSSNAVGFWQFKEISGLENDLRIDRIIDERINIVASTRAAATYLKSHNSYFDNWAYSLIAYQAGRYGADKLIDKKNIGKNKLIIDKNTYWYLTKFLAHKVAYENALGSSEVPYFLFEKTDAAGMTLKDVAKEHDVPLSLIEEYNKWIKRGKVPDDKNYTVIVPLKDKGHIAQRKESKNNSGNLPGQVDLNTQSKFPYVEVNGDVTISNKAHKVKINGKRGILAAKGYNVSTLAEEGGISERKFRKFNDLKTQQALEPGSIYYLQRKRNRAKTYYHTVMSGESMWEISQKYGLKLKKLYRKNRMESPDQPKPGRVLWLRLNRPSRIKAEYREIPEENIVEKKQSIIAEKANEPEETKLIKSDSREKPGISDAQDNLKDTITIEEAEPIKEEDKPQSISDNQKEEINKIDPQTISEQEDFSFSDEDQTESDSEEEERVRQELMIYEIKKGDTFFSIANRFNMRISDLLEFNNLNIRDTLSIGQKISVNKYTESITASSNAPKNKSVAAIITEEKNLSKKTAVKEIEHNVQAGETMYFLAKKYGVSLKEIMEWNGKSDYALSTGDSLIIKIK